MTTPASILADAETLQSLAAVIRWALHRAPPAEFVDVVVQDEYTHDVVLRVSDDAFLVFDTT